MCFFLVFCCFCLWGDLMYQLFIGDPCFLSSEPGWGSRRRGCSGPRGCAGWGWTRRVIEHRRGCAGGRRGAGPSRRRLRTGDRVGDQRSLFGGLRRRRRGRRRRGGVVCARRSPVVLVGLAMFDPLEINTATLQDTQAKR